VSEFPESMASKASQLYESTLETIKWHVERINASLAGGNVEAILSHVAKIYHVVKSAQHELDGIRLSSRQTDDKQRHKLFTHISNLQLWLEDVFRDVCLALSYRLGVKSGEPINVAVKTPLKNPQTLHDGVFSEEFEAVGRFYWNLVCPYCGHRFSVFRAGSQLSPIVCPKCLRELPPLTMPDGGSSEGTQYEARQAAMLVQGLARLASIVKAIPEDLLKAWLVYDAGMSKGMAERTVNSLKSLVKILQKASQMEG